MCSGPVEVDETYTGGKSRNGSSANRDELAGTGWRTARGTTVASDKDREINKVAAKWVAPTHRDRLQGFVKDHAEPGTRVYIHDASAEEDPPFAHPIVTQSLPQYVGSDIHTNSIESLWSMLKRAYKRIFDKLSPKHLDRYVQGCVGRYNACELDTNEQMSDIRGGMDGKILRYRTPIADHGLSSGVRTCYDDLSLNCLSTRSLDMLKSRLLRYCLQQTSCLRCNVVRQ